MKDKTGTIRAAVSQKTSGKRPIPIAQLNLVLFPLIPYYLYFCIAFNDAAILPNAGSDWAGFFAAIIPTFEALAIYVGWFAGQALLHGILPGRLVQGLPLEDGSRLRYRLNGLAAMAVSCIALGLGHGLGWFSLTWIHDNFGALLSAITIFSYAFALFLYFWGKACPGGASKVTGQFFVDYFFGPALNPRMPPVTGFDFKFFCESRPGLIGWMVIDVALALTQHRRYGFISVPMMTVLALQLFYVLHYFWAESFVLSTIDIRTERLGWMLTYGDLALVPMTYCLQAFYLIEHVHTVSTWWVVFVVIVNFAGFYIFWSSNMQKDRFRRDPDNCMIWGKAAQYLETHRGTRLLTSGFWGMARHMNYLGDWIMALAWSLPCLFGSFVPYFYPLWFGVLLVTRERRDDRWCGRKYGADWGRYRERVPWRIVPWVY